ncbi:MAG: signal peptide peptidase SppA [Breznakibacter sp.]
MKKFFSTFLAALLGSVAGGVLLLLFFVAIIVGIASLGESDVQIKPKTVLWLDLTGQIVERSSDNPFEDMVGSLSGDAKQIGLNDLLANIKKAARDENIAGIHLESGLLMAGYATIEEIRNALLEFKKSGKFIYSFAPIYTQKAYYLASVADKVYLPPMGMLEFNGIHSQNIYFKGMLEKVGVDMQIVRHGKFKSAVEPFMLDKMSDASRLQTEKYVFSIWNGMLQKIALQRNISETELNALVDMGPVFADQQILVDKGLIDGLKYKDEVLSELKGKLGVDEKDDIEAVTHAKYTKVYVAGEAKGLAKDKIAVIYAEGEIDGSSSGGIQSDKLSRTIRMARRDSSIKAIVLRINSPGGSALGSELIWREVKLAQESKPTVVSMGDLAASGGYYIACAADSIVAQPNTLTGSIGIFGMIPNSGELMKKIGLSFDGVKTNKFSDLPSLTRPFTSDERDLMQSYIERGYDVFLKRCADGRHTSTASIDSVGQGRVWAGVNALEIGLVDKIGGLDEAIQIAKGMAKLEKYRIMELPELPDPIEEFVKQLSGDAKMYFGKMVFGEEYEYMKILKTMQGRDQIQARLPYDISLN